ncbi:peptidase M20, partial [Ruminococcaceae bacterium OttesenSCG-928-D13]|nr:peptidase M20 [Ruminococcaceae bacterium OttesenSCG-928-D13]
MLDAIRSYVAQHESQFVKLLMDYTNQPSLATDPEGITRCVEFIRTVMEDAGITTQVLPSAGNPMVYGELRAEREDAPTILFYGHYDVQPPDPI